MGVFPYERTSPKGIISIENMPPRRTFDGHVGLKVSEDGRIWVCIDGVSFIRFTPIREEYNGKSHRTPADQTGQDNSEEGE
ncbi:MAG: hypothetical protein AM326_01575 [Candidatus Thorarchaeota archaeon SMTZ-45]|nr:MAG: hypothetical protein AM326_01575 [Candidatus Thorarchaeota archaeon SMTZ-45]